MMPACDWQLRIHRAANGGNVFSVPATAGQSMQSIVVMSSAALNDVSQIRLGGVAALIPNRHPGR